MDLNKFVSENVDKLTVTQIEDILRKVFTAEEWANMSPTEKVRYRMLFVVYARHEEFRQNCTLVQFLRQERDPPTVVYPNDDMKLFDDNVDPVTDVFPSASGLNATKNTDKKAKALKGGTKVILVGYRFGTRSGYMLLKDKKDYM